MALPQPMYLYRFLLMQMDLDPFPERAARTTVQPRRQGPIWCRLKAGIFRFEFLPQKDASLLCDLTPCVRVCTSSNTSWRAPAMRRSRGVELTGDSGAGDSGADDSGASDGAGDGAAAASEGGSVADAAVASEAKASPVGSEGNGSNSSASMRSSSPARGTGKRGSMRHKLPVGCWSSPRLEPARPQDASTLRVHRTLPVICIDRKR